MKRLILACALLCATVTSAVAQNTAAQWRDITRADIEAAYQLLTGDHPALSRTINDTALRERLEGADAGAAAR